jgi:myo-inositol-1-phosphate synthase
LSAHHRSWGDLEAALKRGSATALPASSLYALAAIEEGCPFVNFTPSLGANLPALRERAIEKRVAIMGSDGKTGETLIRSVLAPMFRERQLQVLSWAGYNILGNRDGQVLASPSNRASKLEGKNSVISALVGAAPETTTSIEYISSLHDWKTAWDHIHFRGFLGVKMSLQFTWQGCDSILAAPLVIDLARLADLHAQLGLAGVMTHLACFFKSPMDVKEQGLSEQMQMLYRYIDQVSRRQGGS